MKKHVFFGFCFLVSIIAVVNVYGQEGFTGPGGNKQASVVSVSDAKNLRDDTRVVLQGNIVRSLGHEKYIFRDGTGEITVEIDKKLWRGLSVSENDMVEISGEIEKEFSGTEIDVKSIKKL